MFDLFLKNQASVYYSPSTLDYSLFGKTPNQQFRADIMSTTADLQSVSDGVLANIYQTQPDDPAVSGYNTVTFDLGAFAGQTVRLRFAEVDNQFVRWSTIATASARDGG